MALSIQNKKEANNNNATRQKLIAIIPREEKGRRTDGDRERGRERKNASLARRGEARERQKRGKKKSERGGRERREGGRAGKGREKARTQARSKSSNGSSKLAPITTTTLYQQQ